MGCNGDDGGDPVLYTIEKAPTKSGDEQTAIVGTELGNDLRVLVTRDGNAANGATVSWQTNEGSLNPNSSVSDPDGIATTSWTLGPTTGAKAATATISGAIGSPLAFTATAVNPNPGGTIIQVLGPAGGNRFEPSTIGVAVGTTVTWVWPAGSLQHNIVPDDGLNPMEAVHSPTASASTRSRSHHRECTGSTVRTTAVRTEPGCRGQ